MRNIDIAPTILDLANVRTSEHHRSTIDSAGAERQAGELGRRSVVSGFWEYSFPHTPTTLALRGERYKFIYYPGVCDLQELTTSRLIHANATI